MSKSRVITLIISLAVLFTVGGVPVNSASKVTQSQTSKTKNIVKIQKMMTKKKGQKGQDYAAESTAAVEGVGKGGIKVDNTEKFNKMNRELKDKLYKESDEVKK